MNSRHHTLWTLAFLLVLLCGHAAAQTTVVINPPTGTTVLSELTFTQAGTSSQQVKVSLANGASTFVTVTPPAGVTVRDEAGRIVTPTSADKRLLVPGTWTITVDSTAASTVGDLVITSQGVQQKNLTINVPSASGGGGAGTNTFFASPSRIDFTQTGSTVPSAMTLTLSNLMGTVLQQFTTIVTYTEGSVSNWLAVTNANVVTTPSTSSVNVTVTPQSAALAAGVYRARITFMPTSGASAIDVPVTLIVNAAGASSLAVSPSSVSFSYPANTPTQQTQQLTVTSPIQTVVNASVTGITFASVEPSSFTASPTPTTLTITIPFPSYVPNGTVGSLTLTPVTSSVGTASIPIYVNADAGGGGGFGVLSANPATLSFTAAIGGTVPAAQTVQVTSTDLFQNPFFTTQTTASWLNVQSNSSTTPATLTIGLNAGSLPQSAGTYTGQILLTPYATSGAGFTTAINVTLTLTQTPQVTFAPATPGLTTTAGAAGSVLQTVTLTSNIADVPYTTTVTTATGQNWLTVSPATGNLGLTTNLTLAATAGSLAAGTYQGQVVVAVQGQTVATIPVTFTVNAAGALQLSTNSLTFNHETTSTSAPGAQNVTIASTGSQLAWTATATAQGGWLQVSPTQGTTPGTLQVTVVPTGLQPGTYNGEVRVTAAGASNSPQTITVRLNVTTPAIPQIVSMLNAASGLPSGAVAGLIVTFRGSDLGPVNGAAWSGQGNVPTTLGGVRVLFDNTPAPILYASATQINAIVPFEVFGRLSTRVQVEYQNQRSRDLELRVNDAGPGLFTLSMTGSGQAAALNQNGTVNGPSNPEDRGRVIQLYGTGGGQTNPAGVTGGISPAILAPLNGRVVVRIGGVEARVTYSGAAPGLVAGAIQINAVIPTEITAGANVSVTVQVGDAPASPGNVTIAVR